MPSLSDASEIIRAGQAARADAARFYKLMRKDPRNFHHVLRYVEHCARAEELFLKLAAIRKEAGL